MALPSDISVATRCTSGTTVASISFSVSSESICRRLMASLWMTCTTVCGKTPGYRQASGLPLGPTTRVRRGGHCHRRLPANCQGAVLPPSALHPSRQRHSRREPYAIFSNILFPCSVPFYPIPRSLPSRGITLDASPSLQECSPEAIPVSVPFNSNPWPSRRVCGARL